MDQVYSRAFLCRLFMFVCCFFALSGCLPKSNATTDISQKYKWEGDETVESYIPRDDGTPLTAAELSAFQTAGLLDKGLSQDDRAIVELHFKYFLHGHRATMQRFIDRTARYLPYMKKIFRERGLPEDLVYLSIVESGGNPNAISRAGAVGLWQFMPYTGRQFGLAQNSWLDERRDPFKATYAASDYLLKLYNDFADWHLAIAAYNAGEGKIGRALEGTGATDFFELCQLNSQLEGKAQLKDETRQYVPRLIAVLKIMRNLQALGFSEPSPEAAYDLVSVSIPAGTNLSAMARHLNLTWDEFSSMNPAFRRTASPPTATTTAYVIPTQRSEAETWLTSAEARTYAGWREHTVKAKETLAGIAKKYKISPAAIQRANGFTALPKPGNSIAIPGKSENIEPIFAAPLDKVQGTGKYLVRTGESLNSLAREWGTDVESIRVANKMGDSALQAGQRIIVPANSKNPPTEYSSGRRVENTTPGGATYTVQSGDTVFSIAKSCNTSVQALCEVNGVDTKIKLKPGRVLRLPGSTRSSSSTPDAANKQAVPGKTAAANKQAATGKPLIMAKEPAAKGGSLVVRQGDSLYSIAQRNNTTVDAVLRANKMKPGDKIKVGQKLRLP